MAGKMEYGEDIRIDVSTLDRVASKSFVFSKPQFVGPTKVTSFRISSEQVSDASVAKKNSFTFAIPTIVAQPSNQELPAFQSDQCEKQYKPRISRHTYKPAVNVFAQALKDTAMYEQLKKNSRSQVAKVNPENSITCTNVPQLLLTKVTAKEHFGQFGNLSKITIRPKKQIITVIYATKEEANVAYNKSGEYLGEKFHIEWTKLFVSPKIPGKKKDLQKNIVSQIVSNFFKSSDEEIKSELDAMTNLEYNIHIPVKRGKGVQSKGMSKSGARSEKGSAKVEKHKSDSQISDFLPSATIEELQSIVQQPAYTSEDKYKVLEARDRLMRMRQVKSHTLAAAKLMSGTCPDMCPEKERLMREAKRQVALYEQLESNEYKINHTIAVKQYSRSSADQEEPMAHELRPVSSLKMTMSYLLHEIANLCDQPGTNLGEWYHFLWDRTRGIRKDITQQELCCTDSVELVEQCARFHIVCSERLCAEEPSIFDKRINSDNLTKCLQSLKYMYHDLRVKGVACRNEPEFRAYIVLLNLNNGNFMWDLQRLPKNIQKSPEVRFALQIYSALESNNYYIFFKLVQGTTYLNACILLRYFNQVRLKALSVLVKAYCRTASTAYPLYELIDILGFEDENEAIYFCEQLGLNISNDGLAVLLNRHNFSMPVLNIKQNRACNLIESKRTAQRLSIGECIVGGKMPEKTYKYHKPHNSFTLQGYLFPESINAQDQNKNASVFSADPYEFREEDAATVDLEQSKGPIENVVATERAATSASMPTPAAATNVFATINSDVNVSFAAKPPMQMSSFQTSANIALPKPKAETQKDSKTFSFTAEPQPIVAAATSTISKTTNIFSKPSEAVSSSEASPFAAAANRSIFSGSPQGNIFMKNVTPSALFSTPQSSAPNAPKPSSIPTSATAAIKSAPKQIEKENIFARATVIRKTSVEERAEKQKQEEEESRRKMQRINVAAGEIFGTMEAEVIQACCSALVKEEIDKIRVCNALSKEISDEILDDVAYDICDSILKEEIVNARKLHEMSVKIKNRVVIKCFNIWKSNASKRKQQRRALENTPVWLQKHSSDECAKLLYSKEQDLVIRSMYKKQEKQKRVKSYSESLAPIETIVYAGIKKNLKLSNVCKHCNYYWKLVISWPHLHNKTILWHHKKIMNRYLCPEDYTVDPIVKSYQPNEIETLYLCIRHFEGLISDHNLIGSDALLFIADASEEIKFVLRRLTKTVLSRDKLMPIPLAFTIFGDSDFEARRKEVASALEQLLKCGYLSMYTITHEKQLNEETILNLTQSASLWLSINKSPANPLEMDYLQNIYDCCLAEELWLRIFDNSLFHEKLSSALEEPAFIINLHNEAVTHLIDIALDPESCMYTKFAPELKKFIKDRYTMPCSYEHFQDAWRNESYKAELEKVMSSFKLPQWKYPWPIDNDAVLHQSITNYCQEALFASDSEEICYDILSNLFVTTGISTLSNFIDVLLYIVRRKISLLDTDLKVIYNRDHIKRYRTLPWWLKSNLLVEYKLSPKKISTREVEKENRKKNDSNEPMVKKRKLSKSQEVDVEMEPLATFCENTRSQIMEVDYISKKIEDRLKEHRQLSCSFEKKLRNALFDETEYS